MSTQAPLVSRKLRKRKMKMKAFCFSNPKLFRRKNFYISIRILIVWYFKNPFGKIDHYFAKAHTCISNDAHHVYWYNYINVCLWDRINYASTKNEPPHLMLIGPTHQLRHTQASAKLLPTKQFIRGKMRPCSCSGLWAIAPASHFFLPYPWICCVVLSHWFPTSICQYQRTTHASWEKSHAVVNIEVLYLVSMSEAFIWTTAFNESLRLLL